MTIRINQIKILNIDKSRFVTQKAQVEEQIFGESLY